MTNAPNPRQGSARPAKRPTCPNCNSVIIPNKDRCISCGMEVRKMEEYRRAMALAAKRGKKDVKIELAEDAGRKRSLGFAARQGDDEGAPPPVWRMWIKPVAIGGSALLLVVLLALLWPKLFPKPEPWKAYPTDPDEAVRQFFTLIGKDDVESGKKAYALISMDQRDMKEQADLDKHLQYFHDIERYLAGEFGDDWPLRMTMDKDNSGNYTIKIDAETLHIAAVDQAPERVRAAGQHYWGVTRPAEFDINTAGASSQMEGIAGALRGVGAGGIENDLRGIVAIGGNHRHETPMEAKMRLLPRVRDPRDKDINYAVIQLWKVRNDPVVQARLAKIADDSRYDSVVRERAKQVRDGSLSEEERIAAGAEE